MRLFFLLITMTSCGGATETQLNTDLNNKIKSELKFLSENLFTEIDFDQIKIEAFDSDEDFFATDIERSLLPHRYRRYILYVNPKAFDLGLDDFALRGILTHEVAHFYDYSKRNWWGLIELLVSYVVKNDSAYIEKIEKQADLESVKRGQADQLAAYRTWLYEQVSEDIKSRKMKFYFQPEELIELKGQASEQSPPPL